MKLLCFDGNSVVNRAFYAIKMLTTKDGRYTNAIYGFLNIFLKVVGEQQPDAVAIAFDLKAPTFRHVKYDKYKATRKGMPPELAEQMPVLKELLTALGYVEVGVEGYEADDILGTFSKLCENDGWECVLATGDRDSLQLVGDTTKVLLTTTQFGRGETTVVDTEKIKEDYGLSPEQLIDVKALMGDSSDNVPGVAGVGEKTALKLIQSFGSLDGVYENIESDEIKEGVRTKLKNDKETAYLSRELVTICKDVPIDADLSHYRRQPGDPEKAARMLSSFEMHSLLARFDLAAPVGAVDSPVLETKKKTETIEPTKFAEADFDGLSVAYILLGKEGLYLSADDHFYRISKELFKKLLADEAVEKRTNDVKNLYHFALDSGVELKNVTFDTSLAAYLLNPSSPDYKLERLAAEYGAEPLFLSEEEPGMGLLQPLCDILEQKLVETEMNKLLAEIELPLAEVLAEMEHYGFLVDIKGIEDFGKMLTKEIEKEQEAVYSLAGREFNINSPKQLGEVLFVDLGLPVGKKTKSGFSTNAEVLEKLRGYHPIIDHILRFRMYGKLNSTYVEGLLKAADKSGRIHTEFKQTEARTGRISSTNPNLQNIPIRTELGSQMRKFFIASNGNTLLDADYSQIELRVLASVSDDERMIDAFKHNRDIHTETASEIFKIPREMITPEFRRRAKAVNFGIVYGIGAFSLAQDVGVSMSEANDYIKGYLSTYSGVNDYLNRTVEEATKSGYVTTMFGRRRLLPELSNSNKTVQALGRRLAMNTPIQGTAADIIKIAMIRVRDRLKREALDARLILQVHDELIVEATETDAARAKQILKEEMEGAVKLDAPLEADVGEGKTWYDAK